MADAQMTVQLTDQDLTLRMRNFEDHFVERKTAGDSKDWLKTVVAFANSAPTDYPCVLYIGVKDDGEIETPQINLDSLQKSLNRELQKAYPPVPYLPKIIEDSGRQALAVIVFGSEMRPHFAGPSYVRKGSESVLASEEQFSELIATRNSKSGRILSFKGRHVSVFNRYDHGPHGVQESRWTTNPTIAHCNESWVTLQNEPEGNRQSYPLEYITLSFDDAADRLVLYINR